MPRVQAFTDGSCAPTNPGPGGWGYLLQWGGEECEACDGEPGTTNNRMEMTAVILALRALKFPCEVDVYTDSQYVIKGMNEWMAGWVRRGWRTAEGEPVKNTDLWHELIAEVARHDDVIWHWVRGHNGHVENERVDKLANQGRLKSIARETTR